jgi:hypothetical protein
MPVWFSVCVEKYKSKIIFQHVSSIMTRIQLCAAYVHGITSPKPIRSKRINAKQAHALIDRGGQAEKGML